MLNISATTTEVLPDPKRYQTLCQEFDQRHAIILPHMVDNRLLQKMLVTLEGAIFSPRELESLGIQEVDNMDKAGRILSLVLARPPLFKWLHDVTNCGPISGCEGRVTRINPGQSLDWHDDMNDERRCLAITIGLSDQSYKGGDFELRRKGSPEVIFHYRHTTPGTAVIFKINRCLEHRVTQIVAGGRTVYAGWFLKVPRL